MKILANDGLSKAGVQRLEEAGHTVITDTVAQEDLAKYINDNDIVALIVRSATKVRKDVIDACPNLKVIARAGVGMDNIDVAYARSVGRTVLNTPNASSVSVAELALGHMLSVARSLNRSNQQMPLEGETHFADLKKQSFTKTIGAFTPSQFKVSTGLGMQETGIHLSTDMFFESVPDEFVDIKLDKWHFDEATHTIPIIIPRNYLNLYNFGFAQSRSLPKLSEGLMSLIQMDIMMRGNGRVEQYKGNIVGFSNRLNTILVPQSFMEWANKNFAPNAEAQPARLIIEVSNPADSSIAGYFQKKGYETEDGKLDAGKTTYFLRLIVGIVLGVGLFISILSFYILMLSIFLLLQKNTTKLESLLLIGYSPNRVALPYQILTVGLNIVVLLLSIGLVTWLRSYYIESIRLLFPQLETGSLWAAIGMGILLFLIVSIINILAVKRKVLSIWMHKS